MFLCGLARKEVVLVLARNSFMICMVFTLLDLFQSVMHNSRSLVNVEDFMSPMTSRERDSLFRLLHVFIEEVETANLTYFMYGGTLLGSYRHHGMIPWDDDMDFIFDVNQKDKLVQLLRRVNPMIDVFDRKKGRHIKLFYRDRRHFLLKSYSWPFIDIFFYASNDTHIWDADQHWTPDFVFPKSHVFPLVRRPYEIYRLPAPYDTAKFLSKTYEIDRCVTRSHSHRYELPMPGIAMNSVPCHVLHNAFPFVTRKFQEDGTVIEVLVNASKEFSNTEHITRAVAP